MPADDPSGARPGPVVLRIKLRYEDLETMVQRFAVNVGRSGLFLPTKSIQPLGTEIKFELRIADDTPVLVGLGRVKSSRAPDPANPRAAFGMAIELMRVTREGREVIIRMIERRRVLGLADVAIPMPEDVDAAKRADVETQPRIDTGAIAITTRPSAASGPVIAQRALETAPIAVPKPEAAPRESGPSFLSKPERESGPILASPPSEGLLTSPRRPSSGPIAVARAERSVGTPAPSLAPEPARTKRPRLADVLAKAEASGPLASAFPNDSLDDNIDVAAALARARALAGSDLDAELEALTDRAAAPFAEITIEAASAELARQLGGVAVLRGRRDRNEQAGWAPPPKTESPPPASEPARDEAPADGEPARDEAPADGEPARDERLWSRPDPDAGDGRPSLSRAGARSRRRSSRDSTNRRFGSDPERDADDRAGSEPDSRAGSEPPIAARDEHSASSEPPAIDPLRDAASDARAEATPDENFARDFTGRTRAAARDHDHDAIPQPIMPTPPAGLPVAPVEAIDAAPIAPEPADTAVGQPDFVPPDDPSDFGNPSHFDATATGDRLDRPFARPITSSREMDQLAADAAAAIAGRDGSGVRRIERPDEAPPVPVEAAPVEELVVTPPSPQPALLIDDDADLSSFERALDAARIQTGVSHQPAPPPAIEDDEDIAELDPDDLEELPGESTHIGDVPGTSDAELVAHLDRHLAQAEVEADEELSDIRPPIDAAAADFEGEEISDLDVVAEADAADDDLLAAHGEREAASGGYPAVPDDAQVPAPDPAPQPGDSFNDFAARLDLGDDEPSNHGGMSFTDYDRNLGDLPPNRSTGVELGKFDPTYDQAYAPAGTYDDPQGIGGGEDFDEPHQFSPHQPQPAYESFDEPHGFSTQTPAPRQRGRSRPEADYELENALSTLDVDLDALEIPREQPAPQRGRPLPGMPPERAASVRPSNRLRRAPSEDDGGVLIDFDDDDEQ